MIANRSGIFSAEVELNLYVQGKRYEIGHLGSDFAILDQTQLVDATEGELETVIDGKSSRWRVRFTSPITGESKRFTFEAV